MNAKVSKRLRKEAKLKLGRDKSPRELGSQLIGNDTYVKENPAYKVYKLLKKEYKRHGTPLE